MDFSAVMQHRRRRTIFTVTFMILLAFLIVLFSRHPESNWLPQRSNQSSLNSYNFDNESLEDGISSSGEGYEDPGQFIQDFRPRYEFSALSVQLDKENSSASLEDVVPKIIQDGVISLNVENIEGFIVDISRIAEVGGGSVSHSRVSYGDADRFATVVLRIPAKKFDRSLAQIRSVATSIVSEETLSRDVTRTVVDISAQLKNKQAQETQIRSFFEKAKDVSDLIEVEEALSRVRGEIERLQGQLNYLELLSSFSTISITVHENVRTVSKDSWNPSIVVRDSFAQLIDRSQNLINKVLRIAISSLPLFVIVALALWFAYYFTVRIVAFFLSRKDH